MNDSDHLDVILTDITEWLEAQGAPATPRNICHAMFTTNYADWLDGEAPLEPTCDLEQDSGQDSGQDYGVFAMVLLFGFCFLAGVAGLIILIC